MLLLLVISLSVIIAGDLTQCYYCWWSHSMLRFIIIFYLTTMS